jgi:hypothetical protein
MNTNNTHTHPLTAAIDTIATAVDEALVIATESDSSDALLARLATARAGIVRVDLITHVIDIPLDQPRTYADELPPGARPKPLNLPKLQAIPQKHGEKLRPGIGAKLKRPLDYECPTCHAAPGTFCFKFTTQGKHGVPTEERNQGTSFHALRSARSRDANSKIKAEYDRTQAKAMQ